MITLGLAFFTLVGTYILSFSFHIFVFARVVFIITIFLLLIYIYSRSSYYNELVNFLKVVLGLGSLSIQTNYLNALESYQKKKGHIGMSTVSVAELLYRIRNPKGQYGYNRFGPKRFLLRVALLFRMGKLEANADIWMEVRSGKTAEE